MLKLRGFATVNFYAADMNSAVKWYSELLGIEPYFQRPHPSVPDQLSYAEFRLGDYQHELGIIDRTFQPQTVQPPTFQHQEAASGAILYWHVDDLPGTFEQLKAMGAQEYQPIINHGGAGFVTASVADPFGNILGVMYNPHYLEILASTLSVS